ncbi:MAG: isoleucine--tRNA ligase [Actinomycetota bacterium]|nr:isoleucine--tRNA ligase [Actinomycetota bacterium]
MFQPVPSEPQLAEREQRVLDFWHRFDIFKESLRRREGASEWVFYEGPPTANGRPGIHHVWARIFKDLYPRYQTMRGRFVYRKAGWDCHGLPVELEVEKELGITDKSQIEQLGIEEFNRRCRQSVTRYVDDWNRLTERIGFWVDLEQAYWTMSPQYIESVWWNLRQMWDQGLLYEGHRVVPYCPRCGTALSDHEVAQGYQKATDPSVYVRFPVQDRPFDLLVWTTTPWTLVSNAGVAVHADEEYVVAKSQGRPLVVAAGAAARVLGDDVKASDRLPGADLVGLRYRRPFEQLDLEIPPRVVADPFVTTTEGTGLVHLAPAFGEVDMAIAEREGLDFVNPVDAAGRFTAGPWKGAAVKEADPGIIADLERRGLLVRAEEYIHTYPFCWRCDTPLIYWAKASWFIRTTSRKDDLLAANEEVNWYPPHIKHGRFGDWLANNVDWALSRDRYWGTPLPIWRCGRGHDTCVGSLAELGELAGRELAGFDPHRPYVDQVVLTCPECGSEARRLPPVIDAWFDSGSMPDAQWHFPFENRDTFEKRFPADYIAEAIDQTRGWFYSLLAISTLLWDTSSYRTVLCLGHLVDSEGRKMAKSLGNALDPWLVLDESGADAMRWYFLTSGSPWTNHRVYPEAIEESARRTLFTLWHTLSFFTTYASFDGWVPGSDAPPVADRPAADRWVLSRLEGLVVEVTEALDGFDAQRGGRAIEAFIDDLSNWYVRRTRPRFWRSIRGSEAAQDPDKAAAHTTLHTCLLTVCKLIAPYTPFLGETLYQSLTGGDFQHQSSVHLEDWPQSAGHRDEQLEDEMGYARRVVALGRSARTDARVRTRQPLRRLVLSGRRPVEPELLAEVLSELNVKQVELGDVAQARTYTIKPDYSRLGPRLGERVRQVAMALDETDQAQLVEDLGRHGRVGLVVGGDEVVLEAEDVDVRVGAASGWAVADDGRLAVALDLSVDEELRAEGWLRELTHQLQNLRKEAGLEVDDRIRLRLTLPGMQARLLERHREQLSADLLAAELQVVEGPPTGETLAVLEVPVEVEMRSSSPPSG